MRRGRPAALGRNLDNVHDLILSVVMLAHKKDVVHIIEENTRGALASRKCKFDPSIGMTEQAILGGRAGRIIVPAVLDLRHHGRIESVIRLRGQGGATVGAANGQSSADRMSPASGRNLLRCRDGPFLCSNTNLGDKRLPDIGRFGPIDRPRDPGDC